MREGIYAFLLSSIISFCKLLKMAFPFRSQQEATMRSERISCHQEERRNLSDEVDELRTKFQTMRSEIAEMKNMLAEALNKINKENDDEEVSHDGPMIFTFGNSASSTTVKTSMEDNNNNTVKAATPPPVQSNFVFGASANTPTGASPFQFGSNIPSPIFQASSGSQEFRGADGSGRKIRIFKHRRRK